MRAELAVCKNGQEYADVAIIYTHLDIFEHLNIPPKNVNSDNFCGFLVTIGTPLDQWQMSWQVIEHIAMSRVSKALRAVAWRLEVHIHYLLLLSV